MIIKKNILPLITDSEVIPQSGRSIVNDGTGWIDLSTIKATATLKVYTKPSVNLTYQVTVNNVNTVYNGGKYLTVNVKDVYGDALKGVKVTIRLSNGISKTFTTDSKGQVKLSTDNLKISTYSATITLNAFGKYLKATKTAKITVKKATPKLTAKKKAFKKSVKTKKYKVALKTNRNKVMKNVKVSLKVKGKTYYAKTNSKGKATFKIKKLTKKGTFKAVVKFKGNKYYNAKTVKAKIIVK